jgi:16S rRNA (adenine1518-N6/adenine1519-N6)-dimethyltransferase
VSHRARKRFGQNFLVDDAVIDRIVDAIRPAAGQRIVEIGPGQAALTRPLAASGARLDLLEIDRDLAAELARRFAGRPDVTVHEGDALAVDFAAISGGQRFRLVGNLPYNISTPLLFHLMRWTALIEDMHFMLQKEVVDRIAAEPGGKSWGRLSVMIQYHCAVTRLFDVPPEAFRPPPRVVSSVLRLTPHAAPPVRIDDFEAFERLVARAFAQRRKTLRNSLRGLVDPAAMEAAGIDPGARPETLGLAGFAALARAAGDTR